MNAVMLVLLAALPAGATFPVPAAPFAPREIACPWTARPPIVDGDPGEEAWEAAPWSEDFQDIRGAGWPTPPLRTRVRLLWDDEALYVAAELRETDLWATYTGHDEVIYHEHDFELFLDPDGDNHDYYELEINALGTVWDLFLTRPYRDEGTAVNAWEIAGLRSAVQLKGTLNNPGDMDHGWSVELALPWAVLGQAAHRPAPPRPGDAWRLNFSRVQWHLEVLDGAYVKRRDAATGAVLPEENWVWSPQGLVAMHYPERWGVLRFTKADLPPPLQPEWSPDELAAGEALMQVYYAFRQDRAEGGAGPAPLTGAEAAPAPGWTIVTVEACGERFTARTEREDGLRLAVDETGRLRRRRPAEAGQ
jgi:hypothetical protein